jgi:hypothetical protein
MTCLGSLAGEKHRRKGQSDVVHIDLGFGTIASLQQSNEQQVATLVIENISE